MNMIRPLIRRQSIVIAFAGVLQVPAVVAQDQPQNAQAHFEAISIKRSDLRSPQGSSWRLTPSGDLYIHAVPLIAIISRAYGVPVYQVVGYPQWVSQMSFDITAKSGVTSASPAPVDSPALRAELQALLKERCHIVIEQARRKRMAWVLTQSRKGARLQAVEKPNVPTIFYPDEIKAESITMGQLAQALGSNFNDPVVDQTHLAGAYKLDLRWTRAEQALSSSKPPGQDVPVLPIALEEQLGLTVHREPTSVDVIVVKSIQKPSSN